MRCADREEGTKTGMEGGACKASRRGGRRPPATWPVRRNVTSKPSESKWLGGRGV